MLESAANCEPDPSTIDLSIPLEVSLHVFSLFRTTNARFQSSKTNNIVLNERFCSQTHVEFSRRFSTNLQTGEISTVPGISIPGTVHHQLTGLSTPHPYKEASHPTRVRSDDLDPLFHT